MQKSESSIRKPANMLLDFGPISYFFLLHMQDRSGLPLKDDSSETHPKVVLLRSLSEWSDGHVWVSFVFLSSFLPPCSFNLLFPLLFPRLSSLY